MAEEQSTHLYLCHLIADLTTRYGPVVRQAVVVNVLDAAFDVLLPEFGIEKRVHIDQMPIEVTHPCLLITSSVSKPMFDVRSEPRLRRTSSYAIDLLVYP